MQIVQLLAQAAEQPEGNPAFAVIIGFGVVVLLCCIFGGGKKKPERYTELTHGVKH